MKQVDTVVACSVLLAGLVVLDAAHAQTANAATAFPTKSVRWVVPFPPGGITDVVARLVGQKMSETWGQPVVIDNRAGATGAIGSELVARAPADGYTILMGAGSTHAVAPAVNPRLSYNNITDFAAVSLVIVYPNMLVVHPSVAAKTVPEFIALLKASPSKYNFSSTGNGGVVHLTAELFKSMTGTDMTHVPYKGSGPAMNDLLAGQIQCAFDNMTTVLPYAQAGRIRALGVTSLERNAAAPEVPAIAEFVPGFEANSWLGIFAPAGTAPTILNKLSTETRRVILLPELKQKMAELGATSVGSSPAEFAAFVKNDTDKWRRVVKAARIVVD
jgi:tripartite-type tricarboxylate transporter receptor subunit TctC